MQRQVAEKFLQWAETNKPLRPISSTQDITERELFGISELDNVRLRAALRWVGRALGRRTSFERYPQKDDASVDELPNDPTSVEPSTLAGDTVPIHTPSDK